MAIKGELSNITKQFKRKSSLMKDEKLIITKVEPKSYNLKILAEEALGDLHVLTAAVDLLHSNLTQSKTLFISKSFDFQGKV